MRRVQNRNVVVEYLFILFISVIPGRVQSIEASSRRPGFEEEASDGIDSNGTSQGQTILGDYFSKTILLGKYFFQSTSVV